MTINPCSLNNTGCPMEYMQLRFDALVVRDICHFCVNTLVQYVNVEKEDNVMKGEEGRSKFNDSLTKFINRQWSRVKHSTCSVKSMKNIDQLLEEEYEILLREIDYLASEKNCFLSFKNDKFPFRKSSEDLTRTLEKHSEEVLLNYITQNDRSVKNAKLDTREDLINCVTEIIISKPKCNNKICTCKPLQSSKEVLTDLPKESGKETQTVDTKSRKNSKSQVNRASAQIQTDDCAPKIDCSCETCPKFESQLSTKGANTIQNVEASTGPSKKNSVSYPFANCRGDVAEVQTSTNKLCVPENFEKLLKNSTASKFTACALKQDCQCEAYDINEAIKRGLVLPSNEICVQRNRTKKESTSLYSSETFSETSSGSEINIKTKGKAKKTKEDKKKKEGKPKEKQQQREAKKLKQETTGCFGLKKKKRRDDNCQGIVGRQQGMQTLPIKMKNKKLEADVYTQNNNKSMYTSTGSEMATQMSITSSKENLTTQTSAPPSEKNLATQVSTPPSKENLAPQMPAPPSKNAASLSKTSLATQESTSSSKENLRKKDKQISAKDKDNQEQTSKGTSAEKITCNKCGRRKKDCTSGCRNTIIIPHASGSMNAMSPGEAESLRMLIKMHFKDTNRQFENLTIELSDQKSEIRRLNEMYQKMMFSLNDATKSKENNAPSAESSSYNRKKETSKQCGCSSINECKIIDNQNSTSAKYPNSTDDCVCYNKSIENAPVRRFGPPNTAVAINRCETCLVEISAHNHFSRGYDILEENKLRKDELNRSKRSIHASQNVAVHNGRKDNVGEPDVNSIATIFEQDKSHKESHIGIGVKRENLLNLQENADEKSELLPKIEKTNLGTNVGSESGNKPKTSKVLIWLRRSWITIKHKTEECRQRDKEKREKAKEMKNVFNFCQKTAKRVMRVAGIMKSSTKD